MAHTSCFLDRQAPQHSATGVVTWQRLLTLWAFGWLHSTLSHMALLALAYLAHYLLLTAIELQTTYAAGRRALDACFAAAAR